MPPTAIVSYDGTLNDQDALALARLLGSAGAEPVLAYIRHTTQNERAQELLEEHEAEALLERAARWLGELGIERRVVVHASTADGLAALAVSTAADLIVFGSDYRTPAGRVAPQQSTQKLLAGGPTALAIAPAAYRTRLEPGISTIGLVAELDDHAAIDTAHSLATHFAAEVTDRPHGADLVIVGSRPEAPEGRVLLSARSQNVVEEATAPVLVIARGAALRFHAPLYVS